MKLWTFIKQKMMRHPTQKVSENEAQMSYEELVVFAELFSQKLQGVHCCAILCHSEMAAAMALLSCFAAGVTAVPLSFRYGEQHFRQILETVQPDAIITDDIGELTVSVLTNNQYNPPKTHPALIMCTSGTTGKPKGAMLAESGIITNIEDIAEYFLLDEKDKMLIARPLYHCAVLTGEFLTSLVKGAEIRFYSEQFNPARFLSLIRQYGITVFCGTPTLLSLMADCKRENMGETLRHICISGECMNRETGLRIANAFPHARIYHVYGLTEASPRISYLPPELFLQYPDCVGIPLRSVWMRLCPEDGTALEIGKEGLLYVKGNNIMLGYYGEPERTAEILQDGWLCTGDIAVINEAGLLKIKGRHDQMIIKAGMNIYPAEIEEALLSDARVREVMVYGFTDRHGVQIGLKIAGNFSSVEEVRQLCNRSLPPYQRLARIEIVQELPKNGSGKTVRN